MNDRSSGGEPAVPSGTELARPFLRISYVVDPAGVLWHVAERRPGVDHDG